MLSQRSQVNATNKVLQHQCSFVCSVHFKLVSIVHLFHVCSLLFSLTFLCSLSIWMYFSRFLGTSQYLISVRVALSSLVFYFLEFSVNCSGKWLFCSLACVSVRLSICHAGGKWTTYRLMAEETVDRCIQVCKLKAGKSVTSGLLLEGAHHWSPTMFIRLIQDFGLDTEVCGTCFKS